MGMAKSTEVTEWRNTDGNITTLRRNLGFDWLRKSVLGVAAFWFVTLLSLASPAAAQVTSLNMKSEPGDYIEADRPTFTPVDGTFSAQASGNSVVVYFSADRAGNWLSAARSTRR
jgi:hypothetical protein